MVSDDVMRCWFMMSAVVALDIGFPSSSSPKESTDMSSSDSSDPLVETDTSSSSSGTVSTCGGEVLDSTEESSSTYDEFTTELAQETKNFCEGLNYFFFSILFNTNCDIERREAFSS